MVAEMRRAIREKILAHGFRRDIAVADVGAQMRRQALLVTGRRQDPDKIELRISGHQIAGTVLANTETVDLLDRPRSIREKRLPALLGRGYLLRAAGTPAAPVGLTRHVGQRVEPVVWRKLHLIDRLVAGAAALLVKIAFGV